LEVRTDFFEEIAIFFTISFGEQNSGLFGLYNELDGRFEPIGAVEADSQNQIPARSVSFYLDDLDRRSRYTWTKAGAPESISCECLYEID